MSFAQQRLWFLAQLEGVSASYYMAQGVRLKGRLEVEALRRSLDAMVERHEALRTVFVEEGGEPRAKIQEKEATRFALVEEDLRGAKDAEQQLEERREQEAKAPFDLEKGPLIRGRLVRLAEDEHVLLLTQHHIVSDGWSMGVFSRELSELYGAFVEGKENPLAELAIQYADYAAWQRQWLTGQVQREQAEYWRRTLTGAPAVLELPTDRPRPAQQSFEGGYVEVEVGEELTRRLKALSQQAGTTLFMTVLAAWAAVLGRLAGQQEVVIGTPAANRRRPESEGLIGFFVNTLALRVELGGGPDVRELLERVRRTAVEAMEHEDLPFEQVLEIVQPPRRLDQTAIFQVMLAWQSTEEEAFALPGVTATPVRMAPDRVKFDL